MNEVRKRLVEKFIMIEFTQGRLNITAKEAGKLLKSTIGA